MNTNFYFVVKTLNIPLVGFVINELNIDINELFAGHTILQVVVEYFYYQNNDGVEFAYEIFDYFLLSGADLNKRDEWNKNIYYFINIIKNKTIKDKLIKIINYYKD